MPPILDLIAERGAAATVAAQGLREQITTLTAELALAESELSELSIIRKTLMRLTGQADAAAPADQTMSRVAYQKILAVCATATDPMRAKDVCLALDTGTTPKDTEGMRAKLKRLTARQILVEAEPGLFTLTQATPPA